MRTFLRDRQLVGLTNVSVTRIAAVASCGLLGAAISVIFWAQHPEQTSDFSQAWAGARALAQGYNPYQHVGPGKTFDYPWTTPYPLMAFLVAMPLAWLPLQLADVAFIALTSALLAWALTDQRITDVRLMAFASFAYLAAAQFSQWQPLLITGVLFPSLGFVLAAKPTIGAALWFAYPSWRAAIGAAAITLISFALMPSWLNEWRPTMAAMTHLRMPITLTGGPLILAALWRWRLPEARLLVGLACVPQSTFIYEALPLFLIPKRIEEAAYLSAATVAVTVLFKSGQYADYEVMVAGMGVWMVWLLYLPCLVMVLRRS